MSEHGWEMRRLERIGKAMISLGLVMAWMISVSGEELVTFDYSEEGRADGGVWKASNDLHAIEVTEDGVVFRSSGHDPYATGPRFAIRSDTPLFMTVRFWSDRDGAVQVFYFEDHPRELNSVRIPATAGEWITRKVAIPSLWDTTSIRFDPPSGPGTTILQKISFGPRQVWEEPDFTIGPPPSLGESPVRLIKDNLTYLHSRTEWNNARIAHNGDILAMSHPGFKIIMIRRNGEPVAFKPNFLTRKRSRIEMKDGMIQTYMEFFDPDRDIWHLQKIIEPHPEKAGFIIHSRFITRRDKQLLFLPINLTFLKMDGDHLDPHSSQAIVPGLEYLALEPSSSEKDLSGPRAWRKLPYKSDLTWPSILMHRDGIGIQYNWDLESAESSNAGPLFDSPDRIFNTGGHVVGLVFPANEDLIRPEYAMLPYQPGTLRADQPIDLKSEFIIKESDSMADVIRDRIESTPLPTIPPVPQVEEYARQATHGWLNSTIKTENGYRHAAWMDHFSPTWSPDVLLFLNWLVLNLPDMAEQLEQIEGALTEIGQHISKKDGLRGSLGHNRGIWTTLVLGYDAQVHSRATESLASLLKLFGEGYRIPVPLTKSTIRDARLLNESHDLDSTNGHSGLSIANAIELAILTGNREALKLSLDLLNRMNLEGIRVPRGSQPWEIPWHTPDILASANLMRANSMGFIATGDYHYLNTAEKWAWTGLPFIYLHNPGGREVGAWSTIPVFGATHYQSPLWIGLPVQWCGLVYAHQLYLLDGLSSNPIWRTVAHGITSTGIQHTWPVSEGDRGGLLPDFLRLTDQVRDGPAINPGTLQINIPYLYSLPPMYSFKAYPEKGFSILTGANITRGSSDDIALDSSGDETDPELVFKISPQFGMSNQCLIHAHNPDQSTLSVKIFGDEKSSVSARTISSQLVLIEVDQAFQFSVETSIQ